jgi:hypothetical protein
VTVEVAGTPARKPLGGERAFFFALLVGVTLAPYLVIPLQPSAPSGRALSDWLLGSMLFLGAAGHVASSFYFYGDARVRRFMLASSPSRYLVVPLGVTLAAGGAYLWLGPVGRAYFLVAFWIWQVHHFTRQNHGILAFASVAWGERVDRRERLAIELSDVAAILATCAFVTPYRETVLGSFGWHLHAVGLGVYACAWGSWLSARPWRRLGPAPGRELVLLVLVAFYAPLFLFRDAYTAVFTYLTAHGLQYLVFMGWVAKTPARNRLRSGSLLVALTVGGGLLISWLQSGEFWARHGASALGFAYGITAWHFLLDAGVWRLSAAFPRRYMRERFLFLGGAAAGASARAPDAGAA